MGDVIGEVTDALLGRDGEGVEQGLRRNVGDQPERGRDIWRSRRIIKSWIAIAQVDDHPQIRLDEVGERIAEDGYGPQRFQ